MPLSANGFPYLDGSEVAGTGIPQNSEDLADALEAKFFAAFTDVAFNGAWTNFGAPYEEVSYSKVGNVVRIRGLAKHAVVATTGVMFTLPAGYRPTKSRYFIVRANAGFAVVTIANTGVVNLNSYAHGGDAVFVAFDQVSFDIAP